MDLRYNLIAYVKDCDGSIDLNNSGQTNNNLQISLKSGFSGCGNRIPNLSER